MVIKLWFDVGIDAEALQRWDDYTRARDSMFFYSHTREAPWTVIRSDDKRRARINAVLTVLNSLPYPDKDPAVVAPPDPLIVGLAPDMFPIEGCLVLRVART